MIETVSVVIILYFILRIVLLLIAERNKGNYDPEIVNLYKELEKEKYDIESKIINYKGEILSLKREIENLNKEIDSMEKSSVKSENVNNRLKMRIAELEPGS